MVDDPAFPRVHLRPPSGWVNDPNGPFRWPPGEGGRYHVFFQHNPDEPVHGAICWGHAVSDDLCIWDYEPVALRPTPGGLDAGGCWSGCVVDDGGVPTIVYTAFDTEEHAAGICLATALDDDLRRWRKEPEPVAVAPAEAEWLGFRDPFVFTHGGRRYAVVGAGRAGGGAPEVLLYRCDDLRRWEFLGTLLEGGASVLARELAPADIWECPQVAEVEGRWVLVVSLWVDRTLTRTAYLLGDLVDGGAGPRFVPERGGPVDEGSAFYAPAFLVEDDRVLMWGWAWEDPYARTPEEVAEAGWAGVLTWPRELSLHPQGRLVTTPARELAGLRAMATRFVLREGQAIPLPAGPVDIELMVRTREAGPVLLQIGDVLGTVDLRLDAEEAGLLAIRVVIDGSLVEVHVAGGQSFTERRYPLPEGSWQLAVSGPATVRVDATVHRLRVPDR